MLALSQSNNEPQARIYERHRGSFEAGIAYVTSLHSIVRVRVGSVGSRIH